MKREQTYIRSAWPKDKSEPETELFTFTYINADDEEQTFITYLTIYPAPRLEDREIFAEIKLPFKIAIDPKSNVPYQLASALYLEGVRGDLKSVTYIVNGEQIQL